MNLQALIIGVFVGLMVRSWPLSAAPASDTVYILDVACYDATADRLGLDFERRLYRQTETQGYPAVREYERQFRATEKEKWTAHGGLFARCARAVSVITDVSEDAKSLRAEIQELRGQLEQQRADIAALLVELERRDN